jgi:hypothetical protein
MISKKPVALLAEAWRDVYLQRAGYAEHFLIRKKME